MPRARAGRQTHNLSLEPDLSDALLYLAWHRYPSTDGKLLLGSQSWVVQDLIAREIAQVLGPGWRDALSDLDLPDRPRSTREALVSGAAV